jgi:hypothetical protein
MEHHAPPAGVGQPDEDPQSGQVGVVQVGQVQVHLVEVRGDLVQPPGQRGKGGLVDLAGQGVARTRAGQLGYPQRPVVVERGLVAELRGLRAVGQDHHAAAGSELTSGELTSGQLSRAQPSGARLSGARLSPEHTMPPASGDGN